MVTVGRIVGGLVREGIVASHPLTAGDTVTPTLRQADLYSSTAVHLEVGSTQTDLKQKS